jgi:hypothetical protein
MISTLDNKQSKRIYLTIDYIQDAEIQPYTKLREPVCC